MLNRSLPTAGAVALLLLFAPAARAHSVHVEWKVTDTELVVVAYFNNDLPADDAEVSLRRPDGTTVAGGRTNDTGTWKTPRPRPGEYTVSVKALAGHEKLEPIVVAAPLSEGPPAPVADSTPPTDKRPWFFAGAAATAAGFGIVLWASRRRWAARAKPGAVGLIVPPQGSLDAQ